MDLQYLHALQGLRESLPSAVESFFVMLSSLGEGPGLVAIMFIVFWCIDKRTGLFSLISFSFATFVGQFIKNIACVYRPWIRDPSIVPAAGAIEGATGYSFPSGHTTGTASSLGGIAWYVRKNHKAVAAVCIVVVLLMMFSRNFLCVHTPQDVLVGLLIALVAIALTQLFLSWIDRYDALMPGHNKDIIVMVVVLALCVVAIVIVLVKPYPMDYVDGQLIVDPATMLKSTFEGVGVFAGLAIGWVLERRLVAFSTTGIDTRTRLIRFVVGIVIVGVVFVATNYGFKAVLPNEWAKLLCFFLVVVSGTFVAPFAFNKLEQRRQAR